jgi:hypothetical protein
MRQGFTILPTLPCRRPSAFSARARATTLRAVSGISRGTRSGMKAVPPPAMGASLPGAEGRESASSMNPGRATRCGYFRENAAKPK